MPRASGLSFQTWPPEDRALWEAAFRASEDRFHESGHASHFTGETRRALRSSYGTFLRFLSAEHPERLASFPSTRIDRDIAMGYVDWRRPMCGAATIATALDRLRLVISYMCPGSDVSWLLPIPKRLAAHAPHSSSRPMAHVSVEDSCRWASCDVFLFPVTFHGFCHSADTFWSINEPNNVCGSKELLGHLSFVTAEKHYFMAHSPFGGRALAGAIGN